MKYVFFSALFFLIPSFFPILSPLIFLFLVPVLYRSLHKRLTFFDGLAWGVAVFSCHLFWFLCLVFFKGYGCFRIALWLLTVAYSAFVSGIWFWATDFLKNKVGWLLSWLLVTVFYFSFMVYGSLFVCGVVEGYSFFNPLLPLAEFPELVWCVGYLGFTGSLICLILFQLFSVLFCVKKEKQCLLFAVISIAPFLLGFVFYKPLRVQSSGISFVKPWWCCVQSKDPMFAGYRMVHDITRAVYDHKDVRVVLMPESTFGWNVYEYESFIPLWCECAEHIPIVFGGQRKIGNFVRNSCFVIQEGKIVYVYDKIHLMPLVERIPRFLQVLGIGELFTVSENVFSYPEGKQDDVVELDGQRYQLFLCSELFFEAKRVKGLPILFLANDTWFCCAYAQELMELFLQYVSARYQVPVLYCTVEGRTNLTQKEKI